VTGAHWAPRYLHNGLGHYAEALASAELPTLDAPGFRLHLVVPRADRGPPPPPRPDGVTRLGGRRSGGLYRDDAAQRQRSALVSSARGAAERGRDEGRTSLSGVDRPGRPYPAVARSGPRHTCCNGCGAPPEPALDARRHLRPPTHAAAIGMAAFAERARLELISTRDYAQRASEPGQLTAQDTSFAPAGSRTAVDAEIGAQLFSAPGRSIAPRKVFGQARSHSRVQLQRALPTRGPPAC